MKVFLTAGTGYVDNAVAKKLLHGHQVTALARSGESAKTSISRI